MKRLLTAVALALAATLAAAQQYPVKPVRVLIPWPPGGSNDIVARLVSQKLSETLGQQFVVDNRGGGGGVLAAEMAVRAPPNGYTILLASSAYGTNPSLRKLTFDPLNDLAPITLASNAPNILVVNNALPVKSVKDLIALAKAKPRELNYASSGVGGSTHLAGELFDYMAGTKMTHVAYKGAAPAIVEVMGGQVQLSFASMPSVMGHVRSGRLRGIAVTSLKRSPSIPEMPTISESGLPGFETGAWQAIFAPRGTPPAIVQKLNREIATIVHLPEVKKQYLLEGGEPIGNSPEEFARWLRAEIAKWAKVVKAANIKVE